jgi:exopolysaccharide/PEP-CTERM locus tyrosine autokinase
MSLVESTLEKLRRKGDLAPQRPATIGSVAPVVPVAPSPAADDPPVGPPRLQIHIKQFALREAGYLPDDSAERYFADYYRQIKRPLVTKAGTPYSGARGNPRLVMMASAVPGDGKTFTCINLALSMARERDFSVVLVDADVLKPHVSQIFGVESEPGLIESLEDHKVDIESLVLPTDIKGLSILPAGRSHEGATELLASVRMEAILARLLMRDPRRIVVFDSSPILVSSEARALASLCGQIVLVVCGGKTPRPAILEALEYLGTPANVSIVVNQGRVTSQGAQYGSYGSNARQSDAG